MNSYYLYINREDLNRFLLENLIFSLETIILLQTSAKINAKQKADKKQRGLIIKPLKKG